MLSDTKPLTFITMIIITLYLYLMKVCSGPFRC